MNLVCPRPLCVPSSSLCPLALSRGPSPDRTRPDQLSDETQRRYAEEVQALQASEVSKQLEDFRSEFVDLIFVSD